MFNNFVNFVNFLFLQGHLEKLFILYIFHPSAILDISGFMGRREV